MLYIDFGVRAHDYVEVKTSATTAILKLHKESGKLYVMPVSLPVNCCRQFGGSG